MEACQPLAVQVGRRRTTQAGTGGARPLQRNITFTHKFAATPFAVGGAGPKG